MSSPHKFPKFVNKHIRHNYFSSVQSLSCVQLFVNPWTAAHQASLSIPTPWVYSNSYVHWVGDAIQPSHPLLSSSPPTFNLSQHPGLFKWVSSLHQVAKVLELQLQHQFLPMNIQDWFPLGRTDLIFVLSKGSSPTPQFKSINSSEFRFLYGPTLTAIHDYWKNHSFDQVELCW